MQRSTVSLFDITMQQHLDKRTLHLSYSAKTKRKY